MVLIGCKPEGRFTEQHDIFFGIAKNLKELIPHMKNFWPEASGKIHIDAWRTVTNVDAFQIDVCRNDKKTESLSNGKLFFINLGGYKRNEFEEYHYKTLAVADSLAQATKISKQSAFYKHCTFPGAVSHIDDKYGIDVDDIYNVSDILASVFTDKFHLKISPNNVGDEDVLSIGYLPLSKIK